MKFILNTALPPHFACILDEKGTVVDFLEWDSPRKDARILYDFLQKHRPLSFDFLGGVQGPGSFSSLRTASGVLKVLSSFYEIPIFQVDAWAWIAFHLESFQKPSSDFVLPSFSDSVFLSTEFDRGHLDIAQAGEILKDREVFVDLLSESKRAFFPQKMKVPFGREKYETLYEVLQKKEPTFDFFPHYNIPAVKK